MINDLVSTGRGSYVSRSETSLADILRSYDRAYPDYVDASREEVIAEYGAKPLADLAAHECRWPVNNAGAGETHFFCGEKSAPAKPYCKAHCRLAYRPSGAPIKP